MSEENKKAEEPKLRKIKSTTASRSYVTGAGTGPNDCMSEEFFTALCESGALKSAVYVCGWGWTSPDVVVSGTIGGSSSSGGWSSGTGSSGFSSQSGTGGSGGNESSDPFYHVSFGSFDWANWTAWSGWESWSGNAYSGNSGKYQTKEEIIDEACKRAGISRNTYPIVYKEGIDANARVQYDGGKRIEVGSSFFNYEPSDQASILWHEFYHLTHNHNETRMHNLDKLILLEPPEDIINCIRKMLNSLNNNYPNFDEYIGMQGYLQIKLFHHSQWYRNEINTYKAEMKNNISKSAHYKCEMRYLVWKYEALLRKAEYYEQNGGKL